MNYSLNEDSNENKTQMFIFEYHTQILKSEVIKVHGKGLLLFIDTVHVFSVFISSTPTAQT